MKKIFLLFLVLAVRSLAINPVPFTEGMGFSFKIDGTGTSILTIYDETGTQSISATASGSTIESGPGTASMVPGKSYTLAFWGLGPPNYSLSFVAPTGYSVYVNGVETNLVSYAPGTSWHLEYYKVELRPAAGEGGGQWGQFSGISVGKAISWGVGLGDLRTGRSAGGIQFRAPDLSGTPASRSQIFYAAPPANVGQIVVVPDGPSNTQLRQIVTPIGLTDLVDVTGGYEIRCYFWGQVTGIVGGQYTFSGSPWKTILVESPATNQLKITETQGSVVRISKLVGTGSTSETGGTITYVGSNTQHTFTSGGTLTLSSAHSGASFLVIGGGGGGANSGGGGGAGSLEYLTGQSLAAGTYSVVVGAGGAAGTNGSNSTFNGTTGYGGGRGASSSTAPGGGGSSGGGAANNNTGAPPTSGSGSNIHWGGGGDNGGYGYRGGGGGGAGHNGYGLGDAANSGKGGDGLANSISGSSVMYGGGGGGCPQGGAALPGGSGGGGTGVSSGAGGNGVANTGAGGGAGYGAAGGSGGSGIVIVSYPSPTMTWTLQEGDATNCVRTTIHTSTRGSGQRDVVVTVNTTTGTYASPSNTLVAKTKYHYVDQSWGGEELESVTADPDTAALTTYYTYHTTSSAYGNYRKVKSVKAPTGNWTVSEYYDDWERRGQLKYEYHPYLDSPTLPSSYSATTGRVLYYEYAADWTGRYTRPTLCEERINNTLVGKTTWSHGDNTGSGEPRAYATVNSYRDGSNSQSTYVETYRADADPDFRGHLYLAKRPDQSLTAGSSSRGTFNTTTKAFVVGSSGDHWRDLSVRGSTSSTGADPVAAFNGQVLPTVYLIPYKSTLDVTIRIAQGYVYRTETWVYIGGGNFSSTPMTSVDYEYDAYGNLTQIWASNNALTSFTYTDGRLTSRLDPDGTETQFNTFDPIGRPLHTVKVGVTSSTYTVPGDITTVNTYDASNHVRQSVTSGGSLSLTTSSNYDLAGRLLSSTVPGSVAGTPTDYTTSYAYSSGGKIVTATLPGGATQVTEAYPDGRAKSVTDSAVVAQYHYYSLNTDGTITHRVRSGADTTTAPFVETTLDWLGRSISEVRPGWSGNVTSTWTYGADGLVSKSTQPGLAPTLYYYDTMGVLKRQGLDVGGTANVLDESSADRITDQSWIYFLSGTSWWRQQTTKTYATTNSSTVTEVAKVEQQIGLPANRFGATKTYDIFGNVTTQTVDVNRSGKLVTTTTDVPDSTTDIVQIVYNGLAVSSRDQANLTTTAGYDGLGRQITKVDPRTAGSGSTPAATTTTYVSGTNQVHTVTDAANIVQATYTYDSAGRVRSVKDALNKFAYTSYNSRNQVEYQWGDTALPVSYTYDNWGRQLTMSTYRDGTGWTASSWPSSPGAADITKWNYQEATGLLSSKVSAYGSADAKTVSYTYAPSGQIATRTGARAIVTTYNYSTTTAELSSVTYSDSTPWLTYIYNRLGNIATVTDVTGTRTLNYRLDGTLELKSEDLPSFYGSRRITYPHATSGVIGRSTGLQLGSSGSPTADQSVTYSYDTYGRFNSLAGGGTTLEYAYTDKSNFLESISDSVSHWKQTRTYLGNRDLLDVIETRIGTTGPAKAKFDYDHDNVGRRKAVARTGTLYARYGDGSQGLDTAWDYDDRSQVKSEQTKLGGSTNLLTGRNDAYAWDNFGNRSSTSGTTHNSSTANYTTNALNQYTQRTVPGVFDVTGASASTTVQVNGSSAGVTRHGEYFFKGEAFTNTSNAAYTTTLAVSDGTTSNDTTAFVAKTPEQFTYDNDGNMTATGQIDYCLYDAENRLIWAQTAVSAYTALPTGVPIDGWRYKYDYLGRRVSKITYTWNSSTSQWDFSSEQRYLYSGWSQLAELNGSTGSIIKNCYWGLDWSGTLAGAGGVGGLGLIVEGGVSYLPMYDGNGNVMGLIKASTGSIDAAYEYDAFGQTLRETGPYAASNPFRFSTKYTDLETGLVYYGLRYYSPTMGRFINKDPIEESGGLNLYGFCGNNGVNGWDYLGMWLHNSDPVIEAQVIEFLGQMAGGPYASQYVGLMQTLGLPTAESLMFSGASSSGATSYMGQYVNADGSLSWTNPNDAGSGSVGLVDQLNGFVAPPAFQGTPGRTGADSEDVAKLETFRVNARDTVDVNAWANRVSAPQAPNSDFFSQSLDGGKTQSGVVTRDPPPGVKWGNDKSVRAAADQMWKDSNPNGDISAKREQGAWVVEHGMLWWKSYEVVRWKSGMDGDNRIKIPSSVPRNTVGTIHTHPLTDAQGGRASPWGSPDDIPMTSKYGVPGLVLTHEGDYWVYPQ